MVPAFAVAPMVEFDCAFGRTSEKAMRAMLDLANQHLAAIDRIEGDVRAWWDKCIEDRVDNRRRYAALGAKSECRFWPLKNLSAVSIEPPGYVRAYPLEGESGELRLVLCNVTHPRVYRDGTFRHAWDCPEYRDDDGNLYLKTPLLPFGERGIHVARSIGLEVQRRCGVPHERVMQDLFSPGA
jgi:hypothetical protein